MRKSRERFAVSTEGMRQLHAGRPLWKLIKELVQNSWDEEPEVTRSDLVIRHGPKRGQVTVEATDDGPGFANIEDAYTLMRPTPKRGRPEKRGRFNLGEKEAVSVASLAIIDTVGKTVTFDRTGRSIKRNSRTRGTVVSLVLPGSKPGIEEAVTMLRRFRPSESVFTVNGVEVEKREPVVSVEAVLPTVLQEGPGEPMRPTARRVRIDILEKADPETGWLYEMGIPVQPVRLPYDVDVQQKIPLSPLRDSANPAYLRRISTEVLNATYDLVPKEEFAEGWARAGMAGKEAKPEAIRAAVKGIGGEKAVLWSSDTDANMKAAESGFTVLPRGTFGKKELEAAREVAGLRTSHEAFGVSRTADVKIIEPDENMSAFAEWVRRLAALAGLDPRIVFIRSPKARTAADCTGGTDTPTLRFNVSRLGRPFFAGRGVEQLRLVIHELGHAKAETPMEHGPKWGEACCRVAGAILAGVFVAAEMENP